MANYLGAQQIPMNYMTYDINNNDFNNRHCQDRIPIYQQYQNLYYNTIFNPPLTDNTPINRNPENLPCDVRPTYLTLNYNSKFSYVQTPETNPFSYYHKTPAKEGYYKQYNDNYKHDLNHHRPLSTTNLGLNSSKIDYHGIIIQK